MQRKVTLRALTAEERRPVSRKPGLVVAGINRELPAAAIAEGEWGTSPEGRRVWRLALESTGAEAVRVSFKNFHVGEGTVWVLGESEQSAGPYTADGPFGEGEFWSDVISGETVTVAYEPGGGDISDAIPFTVGELSHRFRKGSSTQASANPAAASCSVDVTCRPEYAEPAAAIALMIFESGGKSYNCTGALISSAAQPAVPFFVTAAHCISTPAEARSLVAIFNYQTQQCNGTAPSLGRLPRVNGSTLVSTYPMSQGDFTLLQLSAFPNVDVKVLGWTAAAIASNENVTGISHPAGHFKRIALGRRTRDVTVRFDDGERMPASVGYQVAWFEGLTQNGSSGSPLLANVGGKEYLVGTLTGGANVDEDDDQAVCRSNNMIATYGRFSAVYSGLAGYLNARNGTSTSTVPSFTANPGTLSFAPGQTAGRTTLSWTAPSGVRYVQIRVDSPTGAALTGRENPTGSAQTGDWVTEGMTFYLQDASDGNSLGASRTIATIRMQTANTGTRTGTFSGTLVGPARINLTWQAVGVTRVQIRVNSPSGEPMTGLEAASGSAQTGDWVTEGMTFYLQDASDGNSTGSARTLAALRVQSRQSADAEDPVVVVVPASDIW